MIRSVHQNGENACASSLVRLSNGIEAEVLQWAWQAGKMMGIEQAIDYALAQ